jgi:hypothetical protein
MGAASVWWQAKGVAGGGIVLYAQGRWVKLEEVG